MEQVFMAAQPMLGLSTRTNNSTEMAGEGGKIAALWQTFFESSQLTAMLDSPMYGVYYDYESDMTGDYSVLVGKSVESVSETGPFTALQLREGNYLKFSAQGKCPTVWLIFGDRFGATLVHLIVRISVIIKRTLRSTEAPIRSRFISGSCRPNP
ncbi:GyrI-like domain-containing protein [Shewanella seohaensis]|nr:GyrI-like domain-containing protein [Shewanella seohaensis]